MHVCILESQGWRQRYGADVTFFALKVQISWSLAHSKVTTSTPSETLLILIIAYFNEPALRIINLW